ncbi:MAG: hypothetical protein KJ065_04215 [Anaerolineae bacterium]|nr:hypothetical protein [Anaerolineae bacterium]
MNSIIEHHASVGMSLELENDVMMDVKRDNTLYTQWDPSMSEDAQLLWRINNEYRLRLSRAQNSVELLLQLLLTRADGSVQDAADVLYMTQQHLQNLAQEHRDWRYRFFYVSSSDRRMVQEDRDVFRALAGFSRMQAAHQRVLSEIWHLLGGVHRPASFFTTVANGDLWEVAHNAIADLSQFEGYVQTANQH